MFFAYAVDGADNRQYIDAALASGAAAALYQPENFGGKPDAAKTLAVKALNELAGPIAAAWYGEPTESMLTVGVTGTNGKTSCSQWLATALTALGKSVRDRRHARDRDAGQARRERLHHARRAATPAQSRAIEGAMARRAS